MKPARNRGRATRASATPIGTARAPRRAPDSSRSARPASSRGTSRRPTRAAAARRAGTMVTTGGASVATRVISVSDALVVERRAAGQQVVERGADRVDVGPDVERLAAQLLGRREPRRPQDRAGHLGVSSSRASVVIDRPKSPTSTRPSRSTKQFDGLMSRCRMPSAAAASRPAIDLEDRVNRLRRRQRRARRRRDPSACRPAPAPSR